MRMPGFWDKGGGGLWRALLAPFGRVYGAITLHRLKKPGWRAGVPVISIGNLTSGGAGKTPTALALTKALTLRGETPFILSRGYGGREAGPLRVEFDHHTAEEVGDEPLLLARDAPVVIARNRKAGAMLAIKQGASCILLDDGLQNPALQKDFSLCVVDGGFGFGNGAVLPAGPLRAPVQPMMQHIDAFLMIGADKMGVGALFSAQKPVFHTRMIADQAMSATLSGQKVFAFSGIGRPDKFRATLEEAGAEIIGFHAFADHHLYTDAEAERLLHEARKEGAMLVTTQKDHVRLAGSITLERLFAASRVVPITVPLDDALVAAVYDALLSARRRISTASGSA